MKGESGGRRIGTMEYLASGVATFAVLLLMFAAFDDITTPDLPEQQHRGRYTFA